MKPYRKLYICSQLKSRTSNMTYNGFVFQTSIRNPHKCINTTLGIFILWDLNPLYLTKIFVSPNCHPLGISLALKRFSAYITVIPTVYRLWPHLYKLPI